MRDTSAASLVVGYFGGVDSKGRLVLSGGDWCSSGGVARSGVIDTEVLTPFSRIREPTCLYADTNTQPHTHALHVHTHIRLPSLSLLNPPSVNVH